MNIETMTLAQLLVELEIAEYADTDTGFTPDDIRFEIDNRFPGALPSMNDEHKALLADLEKLSADLAGQFPASAFDATGFDTPALRWLVEDLTDALTEIQTEGKAR